MVVESRTWSSYQTAIFEFGAESKQSGMVIGVAGCAKTTTIEEMCRRLPKDTEIKYLVFNKRNADEAEQRMPANVEPSTFHSACNSSLTRRLKPRPRLDTKKSYNIIREMCDLGIMSRAEDRMWAGSLVKLVGLAKNAGIGCENLTADTPDAWLDLVDHYDLDFERVDDIDADVTERAISLAHDVLSASNADLTVIDFDDMLYQTVRLDISLPKYPLVCVDEAQDTNPIQRAILQKMVAPGGRLIAVGDPRQAIYGFRGASADAMDLMRDEFACERLPLSVNYRCSRAVIEAAREHCPEIEAHDAAPLGSVSTRDMMRVTDFEPTDAILCRVTAPLITLAYRMLGAGVGCTVLGRDIGEGLVKLVKKMQGTDTTMTIDTLETRLAAYLAREVAKFMSTGKEDKAQSVTDKVESLFAAIHALTEEQRSVDALVERINSLFSDDGRGRVTLATIHKAKGLEWTTVYILDRERMPSKWAKKPWAIDQEQNLIYVAITRARENLVYINSDKITS